VQFAKSKKSADFWKMAKTGFSGGGDDLKNFGRNQRATL